MKLGHRTLPALLLSAFVLLGAACGRGPSSDTEVLRFATFAMEQTPVRPFLDRMAAAPETTAFSGRRTVTVRAETVGGGTTELRYREDVHSDGAGRFAILPVDVETPSMTPEDEDWFLLLLEQRDSFFFRYRDFRVREPRVFRENYELTYSGQDVTVAGRRCVVLEVRPREESGRYYEIAVEPETALVLRSKELSTAGRQAIATVEFESLDLAPDLSGTELHAGRFEEVSLDDPELADGLPGFELLEPTFLPAGYQHRETRVLTADGSTWAKHIYGDGCELLVFMHRAVFPALGGTGGPTLAAGLQADRVRLTTVGPWTCLQGEVGVQQVILMGKVDEDALLLTLQSALE